MLVGAWLSLHTTDEKVSTHYSVKTNLYGTYALLGHFEIPDNPAITCKCKILPVAYRSVTHRTVPYNTSQYLTVLSIPYNTLQNLAFC